MLRPVSGIDIVFGRGKRHPYGIRLVLLNRFEAEQIFFNEPLFVLVDEKHSQHEPRYHALGKTGIYAQFEANHENDFTAAAGDATRQHQDRSQ